MHQNSSAGRSFPVEQSNSYGRIMIKLNTRMHNNLVQSALVQVDDQIDEHVEKQMAAFRANPRYKESYNVIQKRMEDDAVLSRLIHEAKSSCDNKLSAHALRFKAFRAARPAWQPGWLQRTEQKMSQSTHERVVRNAASIIDCKAPRRAMHYKQVLRKTRYTRGGFPRYKPKKPQWCTVPPPAQVPAPPRKSEQELRPWRNAPPIVKKKKKPAVKPKPKPCVVEKSIEDTNDETGEDWGVKTTERMEGAAGEELEFSHEEWVHVRDWLWAYGKGYSGDSTDFRGQLLIAAEAMNRVQQQYHKSVAAVCKEATQRFLRAALRFLLQDTAADEEDMKEHLEQLKDSTNVQPAAVMHLKKLKQYRKCLARPELPQLKDSDKPAVVYHVFGLAGILMDKAEELIPQDNSKHLLDADLQRVEHEHKEEYLAVDEPVKVTISASSQQASSADVDKAGHKTHAMADVEHLSKESTQDVNKEAEATAVVEDPSAQLCPEDEEVLAATSNEQENPLGDERFRETKNLADDEIAEVLEKEEEPPIQEFKSDPLENDISNLEL